MRIQLWLVMMLWASFSFAQDGEPATGATTEEEYNYCETGYKLQLQMELPMKKGYVLNNITTVQEGERTIEFKGLMRKGDKKPCAILMVYSKPRMAPLYFGIPSSDAPSTNCGQNITLRSTAIPKTKKMCSGFSRMHSAS